MMEMLIDGLEWLGGQTFGPFWIPVVGWTLLAGLLYVGRRWIRRIHPAVEYRLLRALFWALPIGLLLTAFFDIAEVFTRSGGIADRAAAGAHPQVPGSIEASSGETADGTGLTIFHAAGLFTLVALAAAFERLGCLLRDTLRLRFFGATINSRSIPHEYRRALEHAKRSLGIGSEVRLLVESDQMVPMTFGITTPTIVLPPGVGCEEDRLHMTLIHELTHIRRRDYLQQYLEQLITALFAIHPLVRELRREIAAVREIVRDGEVVEHLSCSRKRYARLLYEVASTGPAERGVVALSERKNNLRRRIEAMHDFNFRFDGTWNSRRIGLALGGLLLAGAVFVVACSEMAGPREPATSIDRSDENTEDAVFVAVEDMPTLEGGLAGLQEEITYPDQAREAGVEGRVIVQFIVDEDGTVVDPTVRSGPEGELREEALRVVQKAEFEPGLQRGKPVPVKMSIPITFSLSGETVEQDRSASESATGNSSNKRSNISVTDPSGNDGSSGNEAGRISGSVTNTDGQPMPGANVVIEDTRKGASTGSDGTYTILGVSPGNYDIRITYVGYTSVVVENVEVSAGRTTTINAELAMEEVGLEGISAGGD